MSTTDEKHITDFRVYILVLLGLLFLTVITVTVTWIDLSALTVLVALLIASVKAVIVLAFFMHLKFESTLFKALVTMVLAIYTLVIALTFADYIMR